MKLILLGVFGGLLFALGGMSSAETPTEAFAFKANPPTAGAASSALPEHFLENPVIMRVKVKHVEGSSTCVGGDILTNPGQRKNPAFSFDQHLIWIESGEVLWPTDGSVKVPECFYEHYTEMYTLRKEDGKDVGACQRVIFSMTGEGANAIRSTKPYDSEGVELHDGGEYIASLSPTQGELTITTQYEPLFGTSAGGQYILDQLQLTRLLRGGDATKQSFQIRWETGDKAPSIAATPENLALVKGAVAATPPPMESRAAVAAREAAAAERESFLREAQTFEARLKW